MGNRCKINKSLTEVPNPNALSEMSLQTVPVLHFRQSATSAKTVPAFMATVSRTFNNPVTKHRGVSNVGNELEA